MCILGCSQKGAELRMHNHSTVDGRVARETEGADKFLDKPDGDSFADLFSTFSPHLVVFFRARGSVKTSGIPAFEFLRWMALLDSGERKIMELRFIEQLEYHEIATAQQLPI